MRDAKLITDFTLTDNAGRAFDIIGTYLTPNGHVYLKLKDTKTDIFINHRVADFKSFLTESGLTISIEPVDKFENENFVSQINQTIEI